ncbi:MAG: sigma-54-dependent Fis family transcriptional regulator [candidate division Zixibacteria bacterium]|nr:sigma-54-dependent Fis family transcriptional regulator [candidate division Zixibacteria bacterium]
MSARIMVVDDEKSMCEFMQIMLAKEGYDVKSNTSAEEVLESLPETQHSDNKIDLIIADLMMPEMSGIELLRKAKAIDSELDFIVMTAFASVETAIEALKNGAFDYVTKPFKVDEIKIAVKKIEERKKIKSENKMLKQQLRSDFNSFLTDDANVKNILMLAKKVANSDTTILILGESGVGKEVISKAIHSESNRRHGPFISINCGALPENLLESELFGHVKGSFTGAVKDKHGLFAAADKGTILLDEIGETSPAIQVKLLRALEEKIIMPVGGIKPISVDVRIIAATNANLERMVKKGEFRPDLYYRLNVFPLMIPPLRERPKDIPLLTNYFIKRHCAKMELPEKNIDSKTVELLQSYNWPGNVRQLENVLERAILLVKGDIIMPSDLPELVDKTELPVINDTYSMNAVSMLGQQPNLETIEKAYIFYILSQANWQKSKAAKMLGIDASTLYRKIERYGFKPPDSKD